MYVTDAVCETGWHYYNGNCFNVSTTKANQPTARSRCLALDADLASVSDQEEMDFIKTSRETIFVLKRPKISNYKQ